MPPDCHTATTYAINITFLFNNHQQPQPVLSCIDTGGSLPLDILEQSRCFMERKADANELYKAGKYKEAYEAYTRVYDDYMMFYEALAEHNDAQLVRDRWNLLNNKAQAAFKVGLFAEVLLLYRFIYLTLSAVCYPCSHYPSLFLSYSSLFLLISSLYSSLISSPYLFLFFVKVVDFCTTIVPSVRGPHQHDYMDR